MLKKMCHSLWRWVWALDEEINMQERKLALLDLINEYSDAACNVQVEAELGSMQDWEEAVQARDAIMVQITQMIKEGV